MTHRVAHPSFISLIQEIFNFLAQMLAIVFLLGFSSLACLQICMVLLLGLIYLLYLATQY